MTTKFDGDDETYFEYISHIAELHDDAREIIYNFPAYIGAVNLARFFGMKEMFDRVVGHSGHIADVGTYKGASMLFFAKLVQLFEPYSQTEVHGFDWFKGMQPGSDDDGSQSGKYVTSKERLESLIRLQGLEGVCRLHDLDLTTELPSLSETQPYVRYKLVFLDCGIRDVLEASMSYFWPRLVEGGVLVLDHFNNPASPSESSVVDKFTGGAEMLQIPYSRSPTAFLVKKSRTA